jgi:hypothetical protein
MLNPSIVGVPPETDTPELVVDLTVCPLRAAVESRRYTPTADFSTRQSVTVPEALLR